MGFNWGPVGAKPGSNWSPTRVQLESKGEPVDGRGRVTVSSKLRQLAGIKDQAVVVFLDNYMEVWGEKNWELELNISQVEE